MACVYMIVCVHVYVCMCVANGCTYMFDSLGSERVKQLSTRYLIHTKSKTEMRVNNIQYVSTTYHVEQNKVIVLLSYRQRI